jgi:hypothetical protein
VAADVPRPVNAYVVEHARGLILFDTGQDRASVTDDSNFPAGFTGFLFRLNHNIPPASQAPWQLTEDGRR